MAMNIKQFQMLILSNNMIKEEKLKSKTIWYELKAKKLDRKAVLWRIGIE